LPFLADRTPPLVCQSTSFLPFVLRFAPCRSSSAPNRRLPPDECGILLHFRRHFFCLPRMRPLICPTETALRLPNHAVAFPPCFLKMLPLLLAPKFRSRKILHIERYCESAPLPTPFPLATQETNQMLYPQHPVRVRPVIPIFLSETPPSPLFPIFGMKILPLGNDCPFALPRVGRHHRVM